MKAFRFITAAAVLVAWTGCQNNPLPEADTADALTDRPVVIHAGVDELIARAGMTTAHLATLGISIHNANSAQYSYTNVKYTKSGTSFTAAAGQTVPYWQNKTQEVTVTAYAPYMDGWTGEQAFAVQTDQRTAEAARASDLLWVQAVVRPDAATQTGDITYHNEALHINMQHKMSKLVVNLRYLNEVAADAKAQSLTVKYLSTGCTVHAENGTIGNLGTPADIAAYKEATAAEGYTDCFEAIFPPQQMAFKLELLLDNGQDFIYHHPAFDFQSDIAYTLNLAVGKDKVLIADNGITAENWGHVVGGKLETDDK